MSRRKSNKTSKTGSAGEGWFRSFIAEKRGILLFGGVFSLILLIASALIRTSFMQENLVEPHLRQIASLTGNMLNLSGYGCRVEGTVVASPRFSIEVVEGCDSIYPTIMMWAAILAFPSGWLMKIIGLITGAIVLYVLNIARAFTMFLVGFHFPALFEIIHLFAWQGLFILVTLALYLVWASRVRQSAIRFSV